jgi:hypothetical protein
LTLRAGENEFDRKLGIALGTGMSVEAAATFLDCSPGTVRNHLDSINRAYIMGIKAETEAALAVTASKKVTDVLKPAEERIKSFFDRSFRLSEKALERAEAMGEEIDLRALMAIHKDFTTWSAKFSASEAPKRLEVNGSVEQVHTLSGDVVDRLTAFMQKHQNLLPASRPEVLDAVVVE